MPASQPKLPKPTRKSGVSGVTHVAIIGAGRGGKALMEIFANDPLVDIVAVAEIDDSAPGLVLAKRLRIPVTRDYRMLLNLEEVDLIIDVSGSPDVWQSLEDFHRMGVTILGGASAKFMWELIEARIRATGEIEKTLNKYQSLYRLYVKETGAAVTEERTRIACEIHDGLVQSLAGVNFKLELCQELIRKNPKASLATLRESIKTDFTASGDEQILFPRTKIFLFRIVQEALSNVVQHAKADRVSVQLTIGLERLKVTISDNGVGFNMEQVLHNPEKWDHFGVRGIVERAKLVGGEAKIDSKKGRGTRIVVEVPLGKKERVDDGEN